MSSRILVAYATKAGSTREIAEFIGQTLQESGLEVDVRLAKEVTDLSNYGSVILGSAIRVGHVLPEAVNFVRQHQNTLKRIPTAYFLVCMTLAEDTPENRVLVDSWVNPLREITPPVSVGLFAGKVDRSKLEQPWRFLLGFVKEGPMAGGDWRNWGSIHAWVNQLTKDAIVLS